MLHAVREAGLRLYVTQGVVEEVATHITSPGLSPGVCFGSVALVAG
jgi:hypothetical protein